MARLDVTVTSMPAKYPSLPITANGLDITWTAAGADFALGAQFTLTGKDILLAWNQSGGAARTVTVSSVANEYKRTGDITTYSIGNGEIAVFPQFQQNGWQQSDGKLYFAASAADVYFAVLRLAD